MTAPLLPSGRRPNNPAGRYYDGESKDWLLDQYGQNQGVHPADEGMALSVLVQQGTCKSAPTTGNTLHKIQYLGGASLAEDVRSAIMDANPLKRLVAAGDVTISQIYHEINQNRLVVHVRYVNNRISSEVRLATSHEKELVWYG